MELDTNNHSVFVLYYHRVLVIKNCNQVIDDEISEFTEKLLYGWQNLSTSLSLSGIMLKAMLKVQPKT
ncbi:hypothetical protein DUI34_13905 [Enterococcus faecium]|nr:hypothetical protein [Enterococcus faecium]